MERVVKIIAEKQEKYFFYTFNELQQFLYLWNHNW